MVLHVIDALAELNVDRVVVVVGHGADQVMKTVSELAPLGLEIEFAQQVEQLGTGDAVSAAMPAFATSDDDDEVLVLPGDTPLLRSATLAELISAHRSRDAGVTVLTAELRDPFGYGRIVRAKDGRVSGIVEELDASEEQRFITEVNTSIYCFRRSVLAPALRRLSPKNAQGELYLTDVVGVLFAAGYGTGSFTVADSMEAAGVNDRAQLALAEAELRSRINERWMRRGVTMWDPEATYIDSVVDLDPDVTLLPGTTLRGKCRIGEGATIGPRAFLEDCVVGERARLGTVQATRAAIGADAVIDSFVILAPGTTVAAGERVTGPTRLEP